MQKVKIDCVAHKNYLYLGTYLACADVHTVWNDPGCFALTPFYFWNRSERLNAFINKCSSSKMRLLQCSFLMEIKATTLEKQRSTNYLMSATQWCPFLLSTPKNHWETFYETGVSEHLNHSETPLPDWLSKPRKAFETAPCWSHWSFTKGDEWKRKRL